VTENNYNQTMPTSCGAARFPDRISQAVDERKCSQKRVSDLTSQLVSIVKGLLHSATRANEGRTSARVHRNDDPLAFLTAIASELTMF
jgi:hypothetical protein